MPNEDIANVFTQKNQTRRQAWIKNSSYNRIKYRKEIYTKMNIKKPDNSYFDPDRNK